MHTSLTSALGDKTAAGLLALDLHTVGDLLRHYPRRYHERGNLTSLGDLREGEHATVMARVARAKARPMRQRKGTICEVVVTDGKDTLTLTFFARGSQAWREKQLAPDRVGLFAGKVESFKGKRQLTHP